MKTTFKGLKTQADVDAKITRLEVRYDKLCQRQDKAVYESPEYWRLQDKIVDIAMKIDALMP